MPGLARTLPTRPATVRSRSCLRAGSILLTLTAVLMGSATAAQAHDQLTGSAPADGSSTAVVPARVTLTFSEPVLAVGTAVVVTGPAGQVQSGPAVLTGSTVSEPLRAGSPAGRYSVTWRATAADGHVVSGTLSFTARSASPAPKATGTTPPATPTATGNTTAAAANAAPTVQSATPAAPISTASAGEPASTLWWLAGGVIALLLLVALIVARRPRTTPDHERDLHS